MGVTHPYLSQSSGTHGRPLITGGMMPKAARGKFAKLPAGTALAPYVGSHPDYVPDVSEIRKNVTKKVTNVKKSLRSRD